MSNFMIFLVFFFHYITFLIFYMQRNRKVRCVQLSLWTVLDASPSAFSRLTLRIHNDNWTDLFQSRLHRRVILVASHDHFWRSWWLIVSIDLRVSDDFRSTVGSGVSFLSIDVSKKYRSRSWENGPRWKRDRDTQRGLPFLFYVL